MGDNCGGDSGLNSPAIVDPSLLRVKHRDALVDFLHQEALDLRPLAAPVEREVVERFLPEALQRVADVMDGRRLEKMELTDHCLHWLVVGEIEGEEVEVPLWRVPGEQVRAEALQGFLLGLLTAAQIACGSRFPEEDRLSPGYRDLMVTVEDLIAGCPVCAATLFLARGALQPGGGLRVVFVVVLPDGVELEVEIPWPASA